jgi:hypothetical protein
MRQAKRPVLSAGSEGDTNKRNLTDLPGNIEQHHETLESTSKMEYTKFLKNDAIIDQPNARAEDGMSKPSHWNTLCEGVLIPLGSIFAVFLAMLGMMLLTH